MNNKKQPSAKETVVQTLNVGTVVATIEVKTSNSGYSFLAYRLERSFTTGTSRKNRSSLFFGTNEQEVIEAVRAASAWIRANANVTPVIDPPASQSAGNE